LRIERPAPRIAERFGFDENLLGAVRSGGEDGQAQ
jgi:hypothetical protein